jgi:hypothetical protein
VQRNIVAMQLQMMLSRLLQLPKSLHDDSEVASSMAGTGKAPVESKWATKKRTSIMHERT